MSEESQPYSQSSPGKSEMQGKSLQLELLANPFSSQGEEAFTYRLQTSAVQGADPSRQRSLVAILGHQRLLKTSSAVMATWLMTRCKSSCSDPPLSASLHHSTTATVCRGLPWGRQEQKSNRFTQPVQPHTGASCQPPTVAVPAAGDLLE